MAHKNLISSSCSCGCKMFFFHTEPKARCSKCFSAAKAAEKARLDRKIQEQADEAYTSSIREAVLAGRAPSFVKVTKDEGRQIVVLLPGGRSQTFYRPKKKAA